MKIYKIDIYTRGKSKDESGNPYLAYKAVITYSYVSFFEKITISKGMVWGSCGERDCLNEALQGIKEALGVELSPNDERITHYHKRVYSYDELKRPENWRV